MRAAGQHLRFDLDIDVLAPAPFFHLRLLLARVSHPCGISSFKIFV